jgi:hypothetical protein
VTSRRSFGVTLAALALGALLAACGGGGTTTVHETTVMRHSEPQHGNTLLPAVSGQGAFVKPAAYSFSVDNDLTGKELSWHGWGEPKATAFGTLVEHPANGLKDTFNGSVTASAPKQCQGATYYTEVFPHLPAQADYVPTEPTKLSTPCG